MMQDLTQEEFGPIMLWALEELFGRFFLDNLPTVHEDNAVGDGGCETHFMGDH